MLCTCTSTVHAQALIGLSASRVPSDGHPRLRHHCGDGDCASVCSVVNNPNGLFYCGDSCQTIARGVGFRFADIRTLFHDEAERRKVSILLIASAFTQCQQIMYFLGRNESLGSGDTHYSAVALLDGILQDAGHCCIVLLCCYPAVWQSACAWYICEALHKGLS